MHQQNVEDALMNGFLYGLSDGPHHWLPSPPTLHLRLAQPRATATLPISAFSPSQLWKSLEAWKKVWFDPQMLYPIVHRVSCMQGHEIHKAVFPGFWPEIRQGQAPGKSAARYSALLISMGSSSLGPFSSLPHAVLSWLRSLVTLYI